MTLRRRNDLGEDVSELGSTLLALLTTLGGLLATVAEWLGVVTADAIASGTERMSGGATVVADSSKSAAKTAKKKTRNTLVQLALFGGVLWWLDRDLSR